MTISLDIFQGEICFKVVERVKKWLSRSEIHALRSFSAGWLSRRDQSIYLLYSHSYVSPTPQRSHRGGSHRDRRASWCIRATDFNKSRARLGCELFMHCAIPAVGHGDFKYLLRAPLCARTHAFMHARVSFARAGESSSLRGKPDKSFTAGVKNRVTRS